MSDKIYVKKSEITKMKNVKVGDSVHIIWEDDKGYYYFGEPEECYQIQTHEDMVESYVTYWYFNYGSDVIGHVYLSSQDVIIVNK